MKLAALVFAVPVICLAQGQPRLTLAATTQSFGQLARDTRAIQRIRVSNSGDAPLELYRINSACGCTSTVVGKQALEPGESTELEVTLSTTGLSGKVHKLIEIFSNDPVEPVRTLTLEAEVLLDVRVATEEVLFQDLTRKVRRKASVKLVSTTGMPILVKDVLLSEAPWLGVATRLEGNDLRVDFDLLARSLPKDKLTGTDTVTLQVTNPRPSTVGLRVRWELRPPVQVSPEKVAWAAPAGQALSAEVLLTQSEGRPFRVRSVRTSNPLLTLAALPKGAAARHKLSLRLSEAAPAGTLDEKVFLTLDTPGAPELEVRVVAVLR